MRKRNVATISTRLLGAVLAPALWLGFLLLIAGLRAALYWQVAHEERILRWGNLVTAALIGVAILCSAELVRFGTSGEDLMAAFNLRHTIIAGD